jgi:hypothetical protein
MPTPTAGEKWLIRRLERIGELANDTSLIPVVRLANVQGYVEGTMDVLKYINTEMEK